MVPRTDIQRHLQRSRPLLDLEWLQYRRRNILLHSTGFEKAIDNNEIEQQKQEDAKTAQNIAHGKCILAHKNSDKSVTITIPGNGALEYSNIAHARRDVFRLEEEFNKEVVWI